MFEGSESTTNRFIFPDIERERGEFDRVAKTYNVDTDTLMFLAKAEGKLVELEDQMWSKLENTDSNRFGINDWEAVQNYSHERDWLDLKNKLEKNIGVDAPIILKHHDAYHLVSGNTRLMVARAIGITPSVLVFEYIHDRSNEEDQ